MKQKQMAHSTMAVEHSSGVTGVEEIIQPIENVAEYQPPERFTCQKFRIDIACRAICTLRSGWPIILRAQATCNVMMAGGSGKDPDRFFAGTRMRKPNMYNSAKHAINSVTVTNNC